MLDHTPIASSHQCVKRYIDKDCLKYFYNISQAQNQV